MMEGFATGFAPAQATKPGFVLENDKFRVTFDGVSPRIFGLLNRVRLSLDGVTCIH